MRSLAMLFSLGLIGMLGACGDDGGGGGTPTDANQQSDSGPVATVKEITCPATPDATVTTDDSTMKFMPMATTVGIGGVVKFTTSLTHNVVPGSNGAPDTDPGLSVGFNMTKCLMFTHTGTFGFHCGPHGFVGTVTVQ